jgi:sugar lactone lactonase YvrE
MTSLADFRLKPTDFTFRGTGLSRPECVLAERDGTLWIADDKSAVLRLDPDGTQTRIGQIGGAPNGLAFDRRGALLIANIGDGKLYRMTRDGRHEVILDRFEGKPLGALNFVHVDDRDRVWVTVSTRTEPRIKAVQSPIPDGFLLVNDGGGWRRVGGDYCFTNEIRIDAAGKYLYVAETALGRVSRHALHPDGSLGPRETFGPEPIFAGARIDGITFDAAGNLWITEVAHHSLIVLTPEGHSRIVFYDAQALTLQRPASLVFTGPDLRTVIVGSLDMDRLPVFRAPVAGLPLSHWSR